MAKWEKYRLPISPEQAGLRRPAATARPIPAEMVLRMFGWEPGELALQCARHQFAPELKSETGRRRKRQVYPAHAVYDFIQRLLAHANNQKRADASDVEEAEREIIERKIAIEKLRKQRMDNDEMEGLLLPADVYIGELAAQSAAVRNVLEGLPGLISGTVPSALSGQVFNDVQKICDRQLQSIAAHVNLQTAACGDETMADNAHERAVEVLAAELGKKRGNSGGG